MSYVKDHGAFCVCGQSSGWLVVTAAVVLMAVGGCRNDEVQPKSESAAAAKAEPKTAPAENQPAYQPVDPVRPIEPVTPAFRSVDLSDLDTTGPAGPGASDPDPVLAAIDPDRVAVRPGPEPIQTPSRTTPPPVVRQPIEPIQTASDFQQTPATEPAVAKTYTIRSGDDFATIAKRTWGSEAKWVAIQRANPDVDPRRLKIGQVIVIPTLEADALRRSGELSSAAQTTALGRRAHVTVEKGDSLTRISRKVYGRTALWETIYQANRDKLSSPDDLKVGMVLAIPPRPASASSSAPRPAEDSGGLYTVQSGDTLSAIARRKLGSAKRWPEIYEANRDRLASPEDLQVGQKLRIPGRTRLIDAGHQTK